MLEGEVSVVFDVEEDDTIGVGHGHSRQAHSAFPAMHRGTKWQGTGKQHCVVICPETANISPQRWRRLRLRWGQLKASTVGNLQEY